MRIFINSQQIFNGGEIMKKFFICLLAVVPLFLTFNLKADTAGNKKIFISDIHMCDARSITPPADANYKPYGWFGEQHSKMLTNFLNGIEKDKTVKEVIILGDLFDGWVCPANFDPLNGTKNVSEMFQKIADAPLNKPVVDALRLIASDPNKKLIYVPGNHDMLLDAPTLTKIIPGIEYKGGNGAGKFEEDGIVGEHGNAYCLFNAPDRHNNSTSILPLGYFITRAVSYRAAKTGKIVTTPEYLQTMIPVTMFLDPSMATVTQPRLDTSGSYPDVELVKFGDVNFTIMNMVFDAVRLYTGLDNKKATNVMNNLDNFGPRISEGKVSSKYSNLFDNWHKISASKKINNFSALLNDAKGELLFFAAKELYLNQKNGPQIVIFGHTHKAELIKYGKGDKISKIYANSGAWVDAKPCTFVETEIVGDEHRVMLKQYNEDGSTKTLQEGVIEAPASL